MPAPFAIKGLGVAFVDRSWMSYFLFSGFYSEILFFNTARQANKTLYLTTIYCFQKHNDKIDKMMISCTLNWAWGHVG